MKNHINLTPDTPEWNPHDTTYVSQEEAMMSWDGHLKTMRETSYIFGVKQNVLDEDEELDVRSEPSVVLESVSRTLHPKALANDLIDRVDTGSFGHIVIPVKSTHC